MEGIFYLTCALLKIIFVDRLRFLLLGTVHRIVNIATELFSWDQASRFSINLDLIINNF